MYGNDLKVHAGLSVGSDCPMRYFKHHDEGIVMVLGSRPEDIEIAYTTPGLARFVELAQIALAAPAEE